MGSFLFRFTTGSRKHLAARNTSSNRASAVCPPPCAHVAPFPSLPSPLYLLLSCLFFPPPFTPQLCRILLGYAKNTLGRFSGVRVPPIYRDLSNHGFQQVKN